MIVIITKHYIITCTTEFHLISSLLLQPECSSFAIGNFDSEGQELHQNLRKGCCGALQTTIIITKHIITCTFYSCTTDFILLLPSYSGQSAPVFLLQIFRFLKEKNSFRILKCLPPLCLSHFNFRNQCYRN